MDRPPELPITDEDWTHTPPAVRVVVVVLGQQVQALQGQVQALQGQVPPLQQQVEDLQAEVAKLRERLGQNSRNSSRPPSQDPPATPPRPPRPATGRRRGGQPGHRGHGRTPQPAGAVQRVVPVRPDTCATCGALLLGADPQPVCHQVTELPPVQPVVVEYQRHTLTCLACGTANQAPWPVAMPPGSFGPRAQATVGYLSGRLGLSQRDVQETMAALFHLALGLGTVPAVEQQVSAALAHPVQAAQTYVRQQPVNNVDETSWRESRVRIWLWINTTPAVTVFTLLAGRGAAQARQVLGADFAGIVGSDRYAAYNWLDPRRRALCWAHLERDFQALGERGGESARVGQALLEQSGQMFHRWYQVKAGTLSRADFQTQMAPIRTRVGALLRAGALVTHDKTRHTCANILKLEPALWTFVFVEGVEPTNNGAERPLRRAVLWRRKSFGTQSAAGSRFVERVLTAVTTLRQQRRDVLDYLTAACEASVQGLTSPSLLPVSPPGGAIA